MKRARVGQGATHLEDSREALGCSLLSGGSSVATDSAGEVGGSEESAGHLCHHGSVTNDQDELDPNHDVAPRLEVPDLEAVFEDAAENSEGQLGSALSNANGLTLAPQQSPHTSP